MEMDIIMEIIMEAMVVTEVTETTEVTEVTEVMVDTEAMETVDVAVEVPRNLVVILMAIEDLVYAVHLDIHLVMEEALLLRNDYGEILD
jgi:hypothetical protein